MIQPLTIGHRTFESNLIQAPLAGVSCAPFRELVWRFGGVAYCCTEMLSAQHIARNIDRSPRYQYVSKKEGPLCWQLSGNSPDYLARASERAIALGADILDLNCGCPQPKIRKKGCGTRLLEDEKQLALLVKAMQQDARIPVTVKMRIDAGHGDFSDISVAQMLENTGVNALIVHGRHWTDDYTVPCNLDAIGRIVESVSIPVIASGDIADRASLQKTFAQTQCAGFMIGRASVGQPWLFRALTDDTFVMPGFEEIGELFIAHVKGLVQLEGERVALLQSRKFAKYYARQLSARDDFVKAISQIERWPDFLQIVHQYFGAL